MSKTIRALTSKNRLNKQAPYGAASHTVNQYQGFDQSWRDSQDRGQCQDQITEVVHNLAKLLGRQLAAQEFGASATQIPQTNRSVGPPPHPTIQTNPSTAAPLQPPTKTTTMMGDPPDLASPKIVSYPVYSPDPPPDE